MQRGISSLSVLHSGDERSLEPSGVKAFCGDQGALQAPAQRDCSFSFQEGEILAEGLVRLNDPFIRWLAGWPSTHSLTESLLGVSATLGTVLSSGGAEGRQLRFQAALTLARKTDVAQRRWTWGTKVGGSPPPCWRKGPSRRRNPVLGCASRFSAGVGPPGNGQ